MINLNNILKDGSPEGLRQFVSSCGSKDDLSEKLEKDLVLLYTFAQNMKIEGNEYLAERLSMFLYKLTPEQLENPDIKKIETVFRNSGMLERLYSPDIILKNAENEALLPRKAHKSILSLESSYFRGAARFKAFQEGEFLMQQMGVSPLAVDLVLDYLYSSDAIRKQMTSKIDKRLLVDVAKLADCWQIGELKAQCDEELCNSIAELSIDIRDLPDWQAQAHLHPKFAKLLSFIDLQRLRDREFCQTDRGECILKPKDDLEFIVQKMQKPVEAAWLAARCTSEELALFSTLKSEFGKYCQIPPGAFGKADWEKAFPITIVDEEALPVGIHDMLEREDPWEPGKKLKETCLLFLQPARAILHEASGDRELALNVDGLEELANKAVNPDRRIRLVVADRFDAKKKGRGWSSESSWVLMRKEVIPGTVGATFKNQNELLTGNLKKPSPQNAIVLNLLLNVAEGKSPYGSNPPTYTRCQDQIAGFGGNPIVVGNLGSGKLDVCRSEVFNEEDSSSPGVGLSACWRL